MVKELKSVKTMYGVTLGVFLAMLMGFGITAFYKQSYSYGYYYGYSSNDHARNILLIAFSFGLIYSVIGLLLPNKLGVFRLGLLVGGFFTMIYSISYPSAEGLGLQWAFGAIAIALIVLIPLGYWKLVPKGTDTEK
jgi:hypothetical protein